MALEIADAYATISSFVVVTCRACRQRVRRGSWSTERDPRSRDLRITTHVQCCGHADHFTVTVPDPEQLVHDRAAMIELVDLSWSPREPWLYRTADAVIHAVHWRSTVGWARCGRVCPRGTQRGEHLDGAVTCLACVARS